MSKASRDKKKPKENTGNQNQSNNTKKESLGQNTDR